MARHDPHDHARREGTTRKRTDDGLPGYRPHGRFAAYRPPGGRDDPQALPDVRPPSAGPRGRCNGHDRRSLRANRRNATCSTKRPCATIREAIKRQLAKLLDFDSDAPNAATLVNNYDWMKEFTFLDFIRDIGKCITVNYMMAKDSVKKRFSGEGDGMSFTEFTYQLVQGYDFLHLYETMNCKIQLGGADQWGQHHHRHGADPPQAGRGGRGLRHHLPADHQGRRHEIPARPRAATYGSTRVTPRLTSSTSSGSTSATTTPNVISRSSRCSTARPSTRSSPSTTRLPHLRVLQKRLAEEITCMIHSREEYEKGRRGLGHPLRRRHVGGFAPPRRADPAAGVRRCTPVPRGPRGTRGRRPVRGPLRREKRHLRLEGECRKLVQGGGVSLNKEKVADAMRPVTDADLIAGKYLLVQRGKKNYYLVIAE